MHIYLRIISDAKLKIENNFLTESFSICVLRIDDYLFIIDRLFTLNDLHCYENQLKVLQVSHVSVDIELCQLQASNLESSKTLNFLSILQNLISHLTHFTFWQRCTLWNLRDIWKFQLALEEHFSAKFQSILATGTCSSDGVFIQRIAFLTGNRKLNGNQFMLQTTFISAEMFYES